MGANRSRLRPEIVADLEENTSFSTKEICELYRQFLHDARGHFQMDLQAFKKIYADIFPEGDSAKFAEHVFRTYDANHNGKLNFREFMTALSVQLKGSNEEKLEWAFNLYDVDENGSYITKSETVEMIKTLLSLKGTSLANGGKGVSAEDVTDHIFKRADLNHDDKISKSEFVTGATQSKTMQVFLDRATEAASSPYTERKERSGSFGRKAKY